MITVPVQCHMFYPAQCSYFLKPDPYITHNASCHLVSLSDISEGN